MKRTTFFLVLVALFLVTSNALAIESNNYRLDWFTPLTGSGGGGASSTSYVINFTVGQAAIGTSSSTSYGGCLGYWCQEGAVAMPKDHHIYLPVTLRNF
jgi:hypothetical protein